MSSATQLQRFEDIISEKKSPDYSINWPHIFLSIDDNLNAKKDEPWMHKQDAWQILCYITLDALEKKIITNADLTEKHKKLLNLICPFLKAIDFTNCPNGGSWEEIDAIRTSVITWETALLKKIDDSKDFYHTDATSLFLQGVKKLSKCIPLECSDYDSGDPHYREADATLIYFLSLEAYSFFPEEEQRDIVNKILYQINSLVSCSGIKRYKNDSYQGLSYYSNAVANKLSELYDSPSGDSSGLEQFQQRAAIVPSGHEAEWTHFIWQLSSVYGQLFKKFQDTEFKQKQKNYLLFGLSLITGDDEFSISENDSQEMEVTPLPAFRIPECYNTEKHEETTFYYPSMHTPLYWSVAECLSAFDSLLNKNRT